MARKWLKVVASLGTASTLFTAFSLYTCNPSDYTSAKTVHAALGFEPGEYTSAWDSNWDFRDAYSLIDPKKLKAVQQDETSEKVQELVAAHTPSARRHLIFIRHGQYHTEFKDDEMRTLTELGREQAVATGKRLKNLDLNISRVVESSMTRAKETCALICSELDCNTMETSDLLREGMPIFPDPPFRKWRPELSAFTEGPRIESAFRKFVHRANVTQKEDSVELFVCHANVIRYIICRTLQFPPEAWLRMSLKHGSITWITIFPSGHVSLKCIGESGHMLPEQLSVE